MLSPRDAGSVRPLNAAGQRELAAVSSFGGEPLQLPFDLQRSNLFLALVAVVAMAAVAVGIAVKPVAGVAVVLAVGVALAVALNEMVGLVLLAALVPVTSGLARGIPVPGFRVSELVAGGVGVVLLLTARRTVRWAALDWLALAYAAATFLLGAYDVLKLGNSFGLNDVSQLAGPFQFLLLYRAVAVTTHTQERRRLVLRLLIWASVPVAILTLGQQFNVPGFRSLLVTLTGTDVYAAGAEAPRATGPFPHWHNLGGYLFMVLLILAALLIKRVGGVMSRPVIIAIAALDVAALIQTLSIAPIVGVIAGSLILGVWLGGFSRMMLWIAVGAVAAGVAFGSTLETRYSQQFTRAPGAARSSFVPQTIQYRYDLWTKQLLPALKGYYVTGYGPSLPPSVQHFPYTESLYIGLLFRGGVILLAIWCLLAAAMALAGHRSAADPDPLNQALGAAAATAVLCLVFMQFIEGYFVDSGTPHVLWILLGLLSFREVSRAPAARRPAPATLAGNGHERPSLAG